MWLMSLGACHLSSKVRSQREGGSSLHSVDFVGVFSWLHYSIAGPTSTSNVGILILTNEHTHVLTALKGTIEPEGEGKLSIMKVLGPL